MPIPGRPTKQLFNAWQEWLYDFSRDSTAVLAATTFILGLGLIAAGWLGRTPPLYEFFDDFNDGLPLVLPAEAAQPLLMRAIENEDFDRALRLLPAALAADNPGAALGAVAMSNLPGDQKVIALGLVASLLQNPPHPVPALRQLAERSPEPPQFANRAMRWVELAADNPAAALDALEKEAAHPASSSEKQLLIQWWVDEGQIDKALDFASTHTMDPRLIQYLQINQLVEQRAWFSLIGHVIAAEVRAWSHGLHILLALIGMLVWFAFLIQQTAAPDFHWRSPLLGAAALLLGAFSVVPTMMIIFWQDNILGMTLNQDPWNDFLYFFLGVGFREELAKLLCILPLVPFLLHSSRLHQLVISACVGLGFALQENLQYFSNETSAVAYGRVMTANFVHLALTGMVGLALFDLLCRRKRALVGFVQALFAAILLHAVYDLFLVNERMARMPFVVILCLSLMAVWFFQTLRNERGPQLDFVAPRSLLLIGLATAFAATLAVAAAELGFFISILAVATSALGLGASIAIYCILSADLSLDDYMEERSHRPSV